MKIDKQYAIKRIAGEDIIFIQGKFGKDTTKVLSLNETALFLWNNLYNRDFDLSDAIALLTERYNVKESVALNDVKEWIEILDKYNILKRE